MSDSLDQPGLIQDLLSRDSMSTEEALELCDTLPIVDIDTIIGRWHGTEVTTGHLLDGLLEACGWYGKEFMDRDHVHPLLMSNGKGSLFSLNPRLLPMGLVLNLPIPRSKLIRQVLWATRFILQTRKTKARVRMLEYRGKVSATMIYDNLPICDTFRLIDHDTLLGLMDCKGIEKPFIFKLYRDK